LKEDKLVWKFEAILEWLTWSLAICINLKKAMMWR